jgi:hypothetical protein
MTNHVSNERVNKTLRCGCYHSLAVGSSAFQLTYEGNIYLIAGVYKKTATRKLSQQSTNVEMSDIILYPQDHYHGLCTNLNKT